MLNVNNVNFLLAESIGAAFVMTTKKFYKLVLKVLNFINFFSKYFQMLYRAGCILGDDGNNFCIFEILFSMAALCSYNMPTFNEHNSKRHFTYKI